MNNMIADKVFYRGDSVVTPSGGDNKYQRICNYVKQFYTEGLLAKAFFNDGEKDFSRLLNNFEENLRYLVTAHIGYQNETKEHEFSKKYSPFLSFSTDVEKAIDYMDRSDRKKFKGCDIWECTHFMFELKNIKVEKKIKEGVYAFSYVGNTENVRDIRERCIKDLNCGEIKNLVSATIMDIIHKNIDADTTRYRAWLIDATTFLANSNPSDIDSTIFEQAIKRAADSREWLLLPLEAMGDGHGYSWKFRLNEHLFPVKYVKEV